MLLKHLKPLNKNRVIHENCLDRLNQMFETCGKGKDKTVDDFFT